MPNTIRRQFLISNQSYIWWSYRNLSQDLLKRNYIKVSVQLQCDNKRLFLSITKIHSMIFLKLKFLKFQTKMHTQIWKTIEKQTTYIKLIKCTLSRIGRLKKACSYLNNLIKMQYYYCRISTCQLNIGRLAYQSTSAWTWQYCYICWAAHTNQLDQSPSDERDETAFAAHTNTDCTPWQISPPMCCL